MLVKNNCIIDMHHNKTVLNFLDGYLVIILRKPVKKSQIEIHDKTKAYVEKKLLNDKNKDFYFICNSPVCLYKEYVKRGDISLCIKENGELCKNLKKIFKNEVEYLKAR